MKNKKGLILGIVGTAASMAVAAWLDRKKDDSEIVEAECEEIPTVETEEVTEEVTEG